MSLLFENDVMTVDLINGLEVIIVNKVDNSCLSVWVKPWRGMTVLSKRGFIVVPNSIHLVNEELQ